MVRGGDKDYLDPILESENTVISSSGVGCVRVERMVPNAPRTDVSQFLLACMDKVLLPILRRTG